MGGHERSVFECLICPCLWLFFSRSSMSPSRTSPGQWTGGGPNHLCSGFDIHLSPGWSVCVWLILLFPLVWRPTSNHFEIRRDLRYTHRVSYQRHAGPHEIKVLTDSPNLWTSVQRRPIRRECPLKKYPDEKGDWGSPVNYGKGEDYHKNF